MRELVRGYFFIFLFLSLATASAQWEITRPSKDFSGLKVKLDYTVSSARKREEVKISYYKDEECSIPFIWLGSEDGKPFFNEDVYRGLNYGNGSGRMNVDISMDVEGLSKAEILSELNSVSYVAYCVKFELIDLTTGEIKNSVREELIVGIDLTGNIGITGFLRDEEENFAAETFFCDKDNRGVQQIGALIQGEAVRICITPDENTRNYGVLMNRIEKLFLIREDTGVTKAVVRDRGVVAYPRMTEMFCQPASPVCAIETTPSNNFYTSDGTIIAIGEVYFMYNYGARRRTIRVPFEFGHRRAGSLAGKDAGNHTFGISFDVKPSQPIHKPRMYRCDEMNEPLTEEREREPLHVGDAVRVCAIPDEKAEGSGVRMHQVRNFVFTQSGVGNQVAINAGGNSFDGETLLLCQPGNPICVFKTHLTESFFEDEIPVQGRGEFRLQFGDERLQIIPEYPDDGGVITPNLAGFAGSSEMEFLFGISLEDPPLDRDRSVIEEAENWWLNTPLTMRVLYIILFIIILFLFCLCFFILLCGLPDFLKKKKGIQEEDFIFNENAPFMPPNATKSKVNDKIDFCDCLSNADNWEFEPNAEYIPKSFRGMPAKDIKGGDWPPREFEDREDMAEDEFEAEQEPVQVPRRDPTDPPMLAINYGEDFDSNQSKKPESYSGASFYSKSPGTPVQSKKNLGRGSPHSTSRSPRSPKKSVSQHSVKYGRSPRPGRKRTSTRDPTLTTSTHSRRDPTLSASTHSKRDPTLSASTHSKRDGSIQSPGGRKPRGSKPRSSREGSAHSRTTPQGRKRRSSKKKSNGTEKGVPSMPQM
jgi:hypothetical protein